MRRLFLVLGLIVLFFVEVIRVYFIMPFPGSQQSNSIQFAYWLDQHINWIRITLWLAISFPIVKVYRGQKRWPKWLLGFTFLIYALVFWLFNFRFLADKMFYQPSEIRFESGNANSIGKEKLVVAIEINGEAKAYPVQLIGYHHQVRDKVGGKEIMVTYCTVCRTGRVYEPIVQGKLEDFRLVGMDHFNALFEDATTKSWWRQATGEAVTGPLRGQKLNEIPSRQMTLDAWLSIHPQSGILQPDKKFQDQYAHLSNYEKGTIKSHLEKRDSGSWKSKSWVVGISYGDHSKAYDWNRLLQQRIINDSLPRLTLVLLIERDNETFHVFNAIVGGIRYTFHWSEKGDYLIDLHTNSKWTLDGFCFEGKSKGVMLERVQAYQEFWHSWKEFHPTTLVDLK
jgi:hypothetical protein